jgi:hypothetical protein
VPGGFSFIPVRGFPVIRRKRASCGKSFSERKLEIFSFSFFLKFYGKFFFLSVFYDKIMIRGLQ